MKTLLEQLRDRHAIAAVGAAVVDVGGTIDVDVAGTTRRAGTEDVAVGDTWHIGSCAKALTAALYARLVEQRRARWGTRIVDLFPDLADSVHGGWSVATIDDLFTCRSGLAGNLTRTAMQAGYHDHRPVSDQRTDAVRAALTHPPRRHGRFRYSNLGYVVAAAAIDRLAAEPFESALQTQILDPLGVATAGFGPPPRILGHRPRLQLGPLCVGRGRAMPATSIRSDNPPVLSSAGRLHLALGDWARVQRLFLDAAGLLGSDSLDHLLLLPRDERGMAMGWAAAKGIAGIGLGMQGSNTMWTATALMSADRSRTVMVVANDGRSSVLRSTARLAVDVHCALGV